MNEADARDVLLVRAFESAATPSWSDTDAARASSEAKRAQGERAPFDRLAAQRAALAVARLAQRNPKVTGVLAAAGPHAWIGWVAVTAAFALGAASDAIGPSERINILAPPLLAVLAWNLAVYAVLVLHAFGGRRAGAGGGPLRRAFLKVADRTRSWRGAAGDAAAPELSRFVADWTAASGALYGARIAAVLHGAAAALVVGALLSLYLRGIAFEFRAGWDSTFLDATTVHRLLAFVLGPAARLSGIELPGAEALARLRFALGPGENAARWIHLYALTMGLAVVLPRTILAALAAWRARSLARDFALPLEDDYFQRLRATLSGEAVAALALPYSYHLSEPLVRGLQVALQRLVGAVVLSVSEPLPQGAEDDVPAWLARSSADAQGAVPVLVAVFPLTATPERETHGAFVRALAAQKPARLIAIVDESEFRRRFTGAEGERRLAQRRQAWERVLRDEEVTPRFDDLSAPDADPASVGEAAVVPQPRAAPAVSARTSP